jgi:hypothetical protein
MRTAIATPPFFMIVYITNGNTSSSPGPWGAGSGSVGLMS